jgi:hypothetical protein
VCSPRWLAGWESCSLCCRRRFRPSPKQPVCPYIFGNRIADEPLASKMTRAVDWRAMFFLPGVGLFGLLVTARGDNAENFPNDFRCTNFCAALSSVRNRERLFLLGRALANFLGAEMDCLTCGSEMTVHKTPAGDLAVCDPCLIAWVRSEPEVGSTGPAGIWLTGPNVSPRQLVFKA